MSTPLLVAKRARDNKECSCVYIWDKHFGKGDMERVFEVLNDAHHITNLEIHACVWGVGITEGFGACIAQNKTLKKLTLMNLFVPEAWYFDLAEGLIQNDTLEEINILRCSMIARREGTVFNPVFEGLREYTTLKSIGLSQNGFKFTEHASVGALMLRNPQLRCVWLSGNSVDDREAELIANAVQVSKHLEYLEMDWCSMTEKACATIIDAVASSPTMISLSISNNEGGDLVGEAVGRLFKENHILEDFTGRYTDLGSVGRVSAFKSLAANDTLGIVQLHSRSGTTVVAKQIFKECISTNHNLRSIKYKHDAPGEKYFKRRIKFPQHRKLFPQLYFHCKRNHFF